MLFPSEPVHLVPTCGRAVRVCNDPTPKLRLLPPPKQKNKKTCYNSGDGQWLVLSLEAGPLEGGGGEAEGVLHSVGCSLRCVWCWVSIRALSRSLSPAVVSVTLPSRSLSGLPSHAADWAGAKRSFPGEAEEASNKLPRTDEARSPPSRFHSTTHTYIMG